MIEPNLQPLTGEALTGATSNTADGARLDIAVNGFWGGRFERTFLDVRIFNPHAPTNKNTTISKCYRKHEAEKKRAYEQRILEVEQSTFTPLIFSATGGMAKQCTTFYKRLASLLADKWEHPYRSTHNIRTLTLITLSLSSSFVAKKKKKKKKYISGRRSTA